MGKQAIGVVGLAVMGRNLALNIESRGYAVSVYNRSREKTDELIAEFPDRKLVPAYTLEEFVASLETPRRILLMVKAGEATDATITALKPLLDKGDVLIDGGNTHFTDTIRRNQELAQAGLHFIGTGVSGGEEGALRGPSIMPGGQRDAHVAAIRRAPAVPARSRAARAGRARVRDTGERGGGRQRPAPVTSLAGRRGGSAEGGSPRRAAFAPRDTRSRARSRHSSSVTTGESSWSTRTAISGRRAPGSRPARPGRPPPMRTRPAGRRVSGRCARSCRRASAPHGRWCARSSRSASLSSRTSRQASWQRTRA